MMPEMKRGKEADQNMLVSLLQTEDNLLKLDGYENNLKALCARIAPDIEDCSNQDKKDAYTYLDLAVKASPESGGARVYLDPSVLTTGQTSASLYQCA